MAKAPKWGQVLWIHRKKGWEKTAPACPIISASREIFFFSQGELGNSCLQSVQYLLVLWKWTATGLGAIKVISLPRGFFWTQMSPVSLDIPYEELQGEITIDQIGSRKWQSPLRGVISKEHVMNPHGERNWFLTVEWENNLAYEFTIHKYFLVIIKAWYVSQNHRTYLSVWKSVNIFSLTQTQSFIF